MPRPPLLLGVLVAIAALALTTLLLYPLGDVAPAVSLGVLYLLAVLLVSTLWGLWLGVATGLAAAVAFNFFHLPPTGELTIADAENWVALLVFVVAAAVASSLSGLARSRAVEADRRRRQAELAAELARLLLGSAEPLETLPTAAKRIAEALGVDSAAVVLTPPTEDDPRYAVIALRPRGALVVPAGAAAPARERVVPALEPLLAAALEREALTREVVETSALRRSDEVKTAVLRSVSHDLRSPLTAILAAAEALGSPALEADDQHDLAEAITTESRRLARLVDQLLDLSRLQAGSAEPREDWSSLDEIVRAAVDDVGADGARVRLVIDPELPLIRADAAQLQRAVANLLENALRYGGGRPVSVRARATGGRVLMRVVDQGPGIPPAEHERIFTPFYRAPNASGRRLRARPGDRARPDRGQRRARARRVAARAGDVVRRRAAAASAGGGMSRRILVVDDEPQILRALRVVLREAGFEAVPAETAEEALDRAAIRPPDAAIVDLVLPDGDGVEVTRRLREWSAMPIIVLSAVGDEGEKVRALEAGADDYVTKPFGPRETRRPPAGGAAPHRPPRRRARDHLRRPDRGPGGAASCAWPATRCT